MYPYEVAWKKKEIFLQRKTYEGLEMWDRIL